MPRRRVAPRQRTAPRPMPERVETKADGDWHYRALRGSSKEYRCPGCGHLIALATPHIVAWPVEKALLSQAAIDERRHWHSACWTRKH